MYITCVYISCMVTLTCALQVLGQRSLIHCVILWPWLYCCYAWHCIILWPWLYCCNAWHCIILWPWLYCCNASSSLTGVWAHAGQQSGGFSGTLPGYGASSSGEHSFTPWLQFLMICRGRATRLLGFGVSQLCYTSHPWDNEARGSPVTASELCLEQLFMISHCWLHFEAKV